MGHGQIWAARGPATVREGVMPYEKVRFRYSRASSGSGNCLALSISVPFEPLSRVPGRSLRVARPESWCA